MPQLFKKIIPLCLFAVVIGYSCSDAKSNPEEEKEINTMDSVAQAVKDSTERLREQTKRVEETLEKLNKEFEDTKQQNN